MNYGFRLATDVTDLRAVGMLKEAEDDINRIIKVSFHTFFVMYFNFFKYFFSL